MLNPATMLDLRRLRVLPALLLLACPAANDADDTGATTDAGTTADEPTGGDPAARPNWHEDIAPLTVTHCRSCHVGGGIAPFSMESYETTKPWAGAMAADVMAALMPPWHALETPECQPPFPYKHDARLDDATRQLFLDWAAAGAPEGDPDLAAPLPEPPSLDLADTTTTARMRSALTIDPDDGALDYFHCLSIDPGNAETVYLDGMQVLAGNPAVVHHVLIYVDPSGESADWAGGVKRDCGGGAGIQGNPQLIAGWVPGGMPIEPPPGVGTTLVPGTRLILNVHYHAAAQAETDDQTGLALRWKTTPPEWSSIFSLIGEPGQGDSLAGPLLIPADEKDHVEEYAWTVDAMGMPLPDSVDVRVWAVLGHMHKIGVDLRVWVEDRDTQQETCLLHTPKWDFNWQRSYAFDTAVTDAFKVKGGDIVHVRCTYDNTRANPGVLEVLAELGMDQPFEVTVGEGTLNEMCITGLGVAVKQ